MHIQTTGTARIKHKASGAIFEIEAEELEWESVGGSERQMGEETEYQASLDHDDLGELTWSLWEYPVGAENYQQNDMNGHELVENFSISLQHDPDEDDFAPEEPEEKRYFAEQDPIGVTVPVLANVRADDQVEYLTWWFYSRYEDPSQETPYNGREGGFLYIHGGPYDARTELEQEFFSFISEEVIERAIEEVEADGILEWAPAPNHPDRADEGMDWDERPEEIDDRDEIDRALEVLEAGRQPQYGSPEELAVRIQIKEAFELLEEELPPEDPVHGGLGHNRPPADERFTAEDIAEMRRSIRMVKTELDKPEPNATKVVKAAGFLRTLAYNAGRLSGIAAEEFAKGLGKSAGEEVGRGVGKVIKWGLFGLAVLIANAISPIATWLSLILPF